MLQSTQPDHPHEPFSHSASRASRRTRTIETARLLLRPWREEDHDEIARLWADPVAVRYTWRQPPRPEQVAAETQRILSVWREHGLGPWAAIDKASGVWIGKLGPDLLEDWPGDHKVEVGWILHRAWWGQGLATEGAIASVAFAFDELELDEVISVTVPANAASRRVMQKAGLSYQGQRVWRNTEIVWYAARRATWLPPPVSSTRRRDIPPYAG